MHYDAIAPILFWAVLLGGPTLAAAALVTSKLRKLRIGTDTASLLVPAIIFFAIGNTRESLQIGLGLALWPISIILLCCYSLAFKVYVVDRATTSLSSTDTSRILFALLAIGALVFAFLAPPWYE